MLQLYWEIRIDRPFELGNPNTCTAVKLIYIFYVAPERVFRETEILTQLVLDKY